MDAVDQTMQIQRLKSEIERAEYRVDVDAVADAVLRRLFLTPAPLGIGIGPRVDSAVSPNGVLEAP